MIVPAKDLSSHFWGFLWVLFSNPNRVSQSRSSWGYSLTRLGRRALETVGSSHLSHILQHSHPGQLLLDQPKVVNFLSKLGTVSSMIHLEEDTCVPLWFSSLLFLGGGLGCTGRDGLWLQSRVSPGWMETK